MPTIQIYFNDKQYAALVERFGDLLRAEIKKRVLDGVEIKDSLEKSGNKNI